VQSSKAHAEDEKAIRGMQYKACMHAVVDMAIDVGGDAAVNEPKAAH